MPNSYDRSFCMALLSEGIHFLLATSEKSIPEDTQDTDCSKSLTAAGGTHKCISSHKKKECSRLFRNQASRFLPGIIRILQMKVLRLTKLMQFIKWQGYKYESSPSTIFRL